MVIVCPKQETPDMIRYDRTTSYHIISFMIMWSLFSLLMIFLLQLVSTALLTVHESMKILSSHCVTCVTRKVDCFYVRLYAVACLVHDGGLVLNRIHSIQEYPWRDKQKQLDYPYPFYVWTLCCNHKTRSALQPQDLFEDNGQVDCTILWDQNTWQQASDP